MFAQLTGATSLSPAGSDETLFWGVSFQLTGKKSCGLVTSLEEVKAAFKVEHLAWKVTAPAEYPLSCNY